MKKLFQFIKSLFRKKEVPIIPEKEVPIIPEKKVLPPQQKKPPKKKTPFKKFPKCIQTDKTSYNEERAKREAIRMTNPGQTIRAYPCEFCSYWHLTHKRKNFKKH